MLRATCFKNTLAIFVAWTIISGFSVQAADKSLKAQVFVSAKSGERLAEVAPIKFGAANAANSPTFLLDENKPLQKMLGFGASFMEAGAIALSALPESDQEAVLRALFDPVQGAGLSAMKTPIGATDAMAAGPFYTYDDTPGDIELKHFTLQRDLQPLGLVNYIKRAQRYGNFILQATMDFPPDWMLVDVKSIQYIDPRNIERSYQNVAPKYYETLARYYLRYVQEYAKQGITIDYLSLFNEPGSWTKITYPEIRDLLKGYVGPLFAKSGVRTQLQVSDAGNHAEARRELPAILDDAEARKYVSTITYHGYDMYQATLPSAEELNNPKRQDVAPTIFSNIAEIHAKYPSIPLWMSEICYIKDSAWSQIPRYDFDDGDFWGQLIISEIEAGASAWTYWNMILDEQGGPWLTSPSHNYPDGNIQHPIVIIDRSKKKAYYTGAYYYLAHFSKFVKPGSTRISVSGSMANVRMVAFKQSDGKFVAEIINSSDMGQDINIGWRDRVLPVGLPEKSITTLVW